MILRIDLQRLLLGEEPPPNIKLGVDEAIEGS